MTVDPAVENAAQEAVRKWRAERDQGACDKALAALRELGLPRSLVDTGGGMALGDPPPEKAGWRIGMLGDSSKILQGTHEGKRLTDTLNDYIATRQKVLSTDADDIKSLNDELTALGEMLSPEAREEKQSTGRRKVAALEQQTQQFNRDVDDKKRTLLQGFTQQLVEIAARIAQTNGFTLVLDKADRGAGTGIVYSSATDITDQVIKEFDRLAK